MTKPREFWIRKGTNNFNYEFCDEPNYETVKSLSRGDQFYDAVVTEPIEGGIHVREVVPGTVTISRDELRKIFEKENLHTDDSDFWSMGWPRIERLLFSRASAQDEGVREK